MNNENKPIDRETKIMLLQALKNGYFTQADLNLLSEKVGFEPLVIEIIDSRDKVESNER
ncbi:hypothetical protein EZS27_030245 [termite gut metagenome]|uniref:Uncharacterized protein n=1 Tax=termite gut metagenome TaxID=433724 RepID=A0A5J4QG90_9ZZZZ